LEDKHILDILKSSNKPMKESEIAEKYADLTDKKIDKKSLNKKLRTAEGIGILNMSVSNTNNEPYAVWETNFKEADEGKWVLENMQNISKTVKKYFSV